MWKARLTAGLLITLGACRAEEPAALTAARPTHGAQASRLKVGLESQLVSWAPRDGSVELVVLTSDALPKYGKGEGERSPDGHVVLAPGEKLTLRDRHIRQEFTFRRATVTELELDYFFRHDSPVAAREVDTGRIVLTRGLMESGFQEQWRSCSTSAQCTVIPTDCGGFASVAKGGPQQLAELFFRKVGARKDCSSKTVAAPVATCADSKCQPAP
ncbi:MAG: hypothetical protein Q8L48_00575 [Archangium sp.]|nr:hypothetical protein [Archangium sp.]